MDEFKNKVIDILEETVDAVSEAVPIVQAVLVNGIPGEKEEPERYDRTMVDFPDIYDITERWMDLVSERIEISCNLDEIGAEVMHAAGLLTSCYTIFQEIDRYASPGMKQTLMDTLSILLLSLHKTEEFLRKVIDRRDENIDQMYVEPVFYDR